jgi:hypothetical protein
MDLRTEDEVLTKLGQPTDIFQHGGTFIEAEKDGEPTEIRTCKSLRYDNQSETATINVNVGSDGKARITFYGKYIGKPGQS